MATRYQAQKIFLTDCFQQHVQAQFVAYCQKYALKASECNLIKFMVDQELVAPAHLLRFTIWQEFEALKTNTSKTIAVQLLADRFQLSERTIWSILKNGRENSHTD